MGGKGLSWAIPAGTTSVVLGVGVMGSGGTALLGTAGVAKERLVIISDAMVIAVGKKVFFMTHLCGTRTAGRTLR
jgi:hypothetical protein